MWSPESIAIVTAVFLVAGLVKGVVGMGLPTVSLGLLALAFGPKEAIALMLVPALVTNIWQGVIGGALKVLLKRLWSLLAMVCIGVWIGAGMLERADAAYISGGLGLILVVYAAISLMTPQVGSPGHREIWLSPLLGGVNGILTGLTGTFVVPGVPYLQALGLDRMALVQAMGILFTISTIALAVSLSGHNLLPRDLGLLSAIALAPALVGMAGGQWVRRKISESLFRKILYWSLALVGAYLAARAFV
ncbi:MAG: sulfite exporter TauE/SafE family protein [Proteobacteria bacterium]|nr:sulfite exporter TauE/SafE family protein [Pseudomonadota bacterium]